MKISKSQLKEIIKEEILKALSEQASPLQDPAKDLYQTLSSALYGEESRDGWSEKLDEWLDELEVGVGNLIFNGQRIDEAPATETKDFVQFAITVLEAAHNPWVIEGAKAHINMKKFYERVARALKGKEAETRPREPAAEWQQLVERWQNLERGNFQPGHWAPVGDASAYYKTYGTQFLQEIRNILK